MGGLVLPRLESNTWVPRCYGARSGCAWCAIGGPGVKRKGPALLRTYRTARDCGQILGSLVKSSAAQNLAKFCTKPGLRATPLSPPTLLLLPIAGIPRHNTTTCTYRPTAANTSHRYFLLTCKGRTGSSKLLATVRWRSCRESGQPDTEYVFLLPSSSLADDSVPVLSTAN